MSERSKEPNVYYSFGHSREKYLWDHVILGFLTRKETAGKEVSQRNSNVTL